MPAIPIESRSPHPAISMARSLSVHIVENRVPESDFLLIAAVTRPLKLPRDDEPGLFPVAQLQFRRAAPNAPASKRHRGYLPVPPRA